MYYKFNHFSILGMSNSDLFVVKDDQKQSDFSRPTSDSPDRCHVTHYNNHHHQEDLQKDDDKKEEKHTFTDYNNHHFQIDLPKDDGGNEEKRGEATGSDKELKTPSLGQLDATVDDDGDVNDGFRTPTSLEHRIPVPTQCPPAPRRRRISSVKRKTSRPTHRRLPLDLSEELESLFRPIVEDDIGRKIKKARRDDTE